MSMHLSVYVGPYIEAWNFNRDLLDEYDDAIYDGRGELGSGEDHRFLIPNQDLDGVDREMSFDRDADQSPVEVQSVVAELMSFKSISRPFMTAVRDAGGECQIKWGVICGMF